MHFGQTPRAERCSSAGFFLFLFLNGHPKAGRENSIFTRQGIPPGGICERGKKKMRELKGKPRYAEKLDHARGFPGVQEAMASSEELLRELDPWCSSQRLKEAWPVGAFISTS